MTKRATLRLLAVVFLLQVAVLRPTHADTVISSWDFENTPSPNTDPLNNSATSFTFAASFGTGTASGVHASAETDWSTPSGNGSTNSFSSNNWAIGDYYNIAISTVGFTNIKFSWDQTGSNTGPKDFSLQYNDGSGFVPVFSYSLTNDSWNPATNNALSSRSFDFSAITSLNNNANVQFRLAVTTTDSINGGTVALAGTGRIDNVTVSSVPEPSAGLMCLLTTIGVVGMRRRR